MRYIGYVETCTCKSLMRPRWSRDAGLRIFMCTRCGKCVPGYEQLWAMRERMLKKPGGGIIKIERGKDEKDQEYQKRTYFPFDFVAFTTIIEANKAKGLAYNKIKSRQKGGQPYGYKQYHPDYRYQR